MIRAARPLLAVCLAGAGCAPRAGAPAPPALAPLPDLPAVAPTLPTGATLPQPPHADPFSSLPPGDPVTLAARDADARALIVALAEAAGVSVLLDPEVQGRVTVDFRGIPAVQALREVLAAVGAGVAATAPSAVPIGPTVFYVLPVNIDAASVELIMVRFQVSRKMAEWIVANRVRY